MAPLEAGATQTATAVSAVVGAEETIRDNETGLLFERGNAGDLANKILKLCKNRPLREKLGKEGCRFVKENFSRQRMVGDYKKLFEILI